MKTSTVLILLLSTFTFRALAQSDTTSVKVVKKNVVTVLEDDEHVQVKVGGDNGIEIITDEWGDTTHIKIGRRTFKVIDGNDGTHIKMEKELQQKRSRGNFDPHWSGLEVGLNIMTGSDYSVYGVQADGMNDWLDLNPGKSLSWNLNLAEFAFKNERKTFGVVTGFGFSFNDYVFNDAVTIEKQNGLISPVYLPENDEGRGIKKSKLHVNYLTAPLLLEIKTPLKMNNSNLYLAGGVIGGLYLGSHTKYKYYKGDKEKNKSSYYINPWKYEITGRIGFGDMCIFVNYSMTSLFKDGQGPEGFPLMIGISLVSF